MKSTRTWVWLAWLAWLVALLSAGGASLAAQASQSTQPVHEERWRRFRDRVPTESLQAGRGAAELGAGVIQYDAGAPAGSLGTWPTIYGMVGNRFNSANGDPLSPGTITRISWYQGDVGASNAVGFGFSIFDPALGSRLRGALMVPATVTPNGFHFFFAPPASPFDVPATFDVLFLVPAYPIPAAPQGANGPFGSIGLTTATVNGQGHHAVAKSFSTATPVLLPSANALLRVEGSVIIPVELVEFEID